MINKILNIEKKVVYQVTENYLYLFLVFFSTIVSFMIQKSGFSYQSGDWIHHFSLWYQDFKSNGGILSLGLNIGDYPPGFNLLFSIVTHIPISPFVSFKLLGITFHYFAAIMAYFILSLILKGDNRRFYASLSYSVVLVLPSAFLNSSVWGQVDMIYVCTLMIAIYYLIKNKYGFSFLFVGVSLSLKPTAIVIFPVLLLIYLRKRNLSFIHVANILTGYLLMSLPSLLLGKSFKDLFGPYMNFGSGITTNLVANFTNVYLLFTPTPGWNFWVENSMVTNLGKWLAVFIIGVIIIILNYKKYEICGYNILLVTSMFVVVVCNFLPGIHDRYMLLADILSILYVIASKRLRDIWIPIFINFVSVFNIINYLHPISDNVQNTRIILSQFISVGFLLATIYLVYFVFSVLPKENNEQ